MFILCFLRKWQYHQYKFQTSFPNICGILLYCEHNNLINLTGIIRFIALNLCTPDRFRKGDILWSSSCQAVSQPFDFLNRRMFVHRIRQNCWVSCRIFGGIALSLMRSRNIAVFSQYCIYFGNKGTCHFDVSSQVSPDFTSSQ